MTIKKSTGTELNWVRLHINVNYFAYIDLVSEWLAGSQDM